MAARERDRYAIPFVLARRRRGARLPRATARGARSARRSPRDGRSPPLTKDGLPPEGASGSGAGQVGAALVCRPAAGFAALWGDDAGPVAGADEAALGRDQSNTSVVLGGRLLLKGYRRIQPGLNPDLELTAYLSEEAAFPGVPRLAG